MNLKSKISKLEKVYNDSGSTGQPRYSNMERALRIVHFINKMKRRQEAGESFTMKDEKKIERLLELLNIAVQRKADAEKHI